MKIKAIHVGIIIVVIMVAGIFIANSMGYWQTEKIKQPNKLVSGEYDAEDIRGSYAFQDISNAFDITVDTLAKAFGLNSENPETIKLNFLESVFINLDDDVEIGTSSVAFFVALYTDTPYTVYSYIPRFAYNILIEENKIDKQIIEEILPYIVDTEYIDVDNFISDKEEDHEEVIAVNGKTTYNILVDYGIKAEDINKVLNGEVTNKSLLIRDICTERGLSFSVVKEQLNALLEK